ncbi:MAG: caspase family protein [Anaerolineales bacterium]|nr:caspase family protein [Anaerolineales bacterium]
MNTRLQKRDIHAIRRWAVLVGVNHYQDEKIRNLRFSVNDAHALFQLLNRSTDSGYGPDRVQLMTGKSPDEKVTRMDILTQLLAWSNQAERDDLLLFYFSGHGDVVNGDAYLLPTDAQRLDLLSDTAVSLQRIKSIMQQSKARAKVIILDACHVGAALSGRATSTDNQAFIRSVFEQAEGIAIFASSAQDELSWEDANKAHGIFTYYLLEALSGEAKTAHKGFVTLNEAANHVTQKVKSWAGTNKLYQRPTLKFEGSGELVLITMPKEQMPQGAAAPITGTFSRINPVQRTFPNAVREVRDFIGRAHELKAVRQTLAATVDLPIAILGDRGIGKTSVLKRIEKMLAEQNWNGRQFLSFTLSPNGIFSYNDFIQNIWDGLYCELDPREFDNPQLFDQTISNLSFSRFANQLKLLSRMVPDMTYVVFIDEFGQIIHQCDDLESNKIEGLISYLVEHTDIPIVFIISLLQVLPGSYGSPFPRRPIQLLPFTREESGTLLTYLLTGYASLDQEGQDWLYEYAGGHPYFIKLMLAKLFDLHRLEDVDTVISLEMLQKAVKEACSSARAGELLGDIYTTYFSEEQRFVVMWLAQQKRPLSWDELQQSGAVVVTAAWQLINRHYLQEDGNGNVEFKLKFMGDWLCRWPNYTAELERLQIPEMTAVPSPTESEDTVRSCTTEKSGVCVDISTGRVYVNGEEIDTTLSNLEFQALVYLAKRSGEVVSKDELANSVYPGEHYEGDDQRISALIYRLRSAVELQKPYQYILTLRKRGFRIQNITLMETNNHERLNGNQI